MSTNRIAWPGNKRAAVCLTFDVDAESGWMFDAANQRRLSLLSSGAFGRRAGLPRILNLLDKHGIPAQFFVPGYTAELDRELVAAIHAKGHPIGCHGYYHERTDTLGFEDEDAILQRSRQMLQSITGVAPTGYRAPLWELTPQTLRLLLKNGFQYDSSLMGDDSPYVVPVGEQQLFELPVTWLLDDWEQFAYSAEPQSGYVIEEPAKVLRMWQAEFAALYAEGGYFMLTMHPEIIGRASRMAMLDELIGFIKGHEGVWFTTPQQLHHHWQQGDIAVPQYPY